MRNLILSWNSYSWIKHCSGLIMRNPQDFQVIIICNDNNLPVAKLPQLCQEARYMQRSFDLAKAGKELGIKKLANLRYNDGKIDLNRLVVQLSLIIQTSGSSTLYYQYNRLLDSIVKPIMSIEKYAFGGCLEPKIHIELTMQEYQRKLGIINNLVGLYEDDNLIPVVEMFT